MLKWLKSALRPPQASAATVQGAEEAAEELQRKGNKLLDEGRLEEARRCYEEAALLDRNATRLVNLGFVLKELGQPVPARQFLLEALALDPGQFDASFMLGSMAADTGELDEARQYFGRAVSLHPVCRDALAGHAGLADADFLRPAPGTAEVAAEAAIRQHGDATEFFFFLGNIQIGLGDFAAAARSFNTVLELAPDNPDGHYNLGVTAQMLGRQDAAIASFRKAVALRSADVRSLCGLASSLTSNGQPTEAVAVCEEALALAADHGDLHNALGNALLTLGRHDEAIASYRRTIALQPDFAEAHSNIGMALTAKGQLDTAIGSLQRAVAIKPRYAEGHNNLGNALQQLGRFDDAMRSYGTAIAIHPHFAQAHNNHGVAASAQGRHQEALASWRRALELKPDYLDAWSNSLYVLSFSTHITPADYLAEAKRFGAAAAAGATPYAAWTAAASLLPEGVPLRVGFVSGDFREHPVGFFLEGVLQHLDPARVSAIAYTTNPADDRLTARIKGHFAGWHSIVGLDDSTAAARIHADGIHLLVDLAGHTAHNRLPLFSWRAAPVQASWLGFFASTGVPEIDFVIADETGVPADHRQNFSEAVRYLPNTRLCFTAPGSDTDIQPGPLPALANGHVTFGCFQNMTKLNDGVLALWGQVFSALPDARLRLQSKQMGEPALREQMLDRLARHGIDPSRVTLTGPSSRADYLAAHRQVDVMLDSFPYGGGTTTCESLWMGVPTITLAGDTMLARQGASLLTCAGLADWVASNGEDYVRRVQAHCSDRDRLAALRDRLRGQVLASPLFDAPRFAGHLQDLLRRMWDERPAQGAAASRSGGPGIDASS